jgi:hypothetical protein
VGTFDNEEILSVLAKCGADIQKKDHAGLSPLDHALIRGACKLAALLQELSGVEEEKRVWELLCCKNCVNMSYIGKDCMGCQTAFC